MIKNSELVSILRLSTRTTKRWRNPPERNHMPLPYQRETKTGEIVYDADTLLDWMEFNKPKYFEKLQVFLAGVKRGTDKY